MNTLSIWIALTVSQQHLQLERKNTVTVGSNEVPVIRCSPDGNHVVLQWHNKVEVRRADGLRMIFAVEEEGTTCAFPNDGRTFWLVGKQLIRYNTESWKPLSRHVLPECASEPIGSEDKIIVNLEPEPRTILDWTWAAVCPRGRLFYLRSNGSVGVANYLADGLKVTDLELKVGLALKDAPRIKSILGLVNGGLLVTTSRRNVVGIVIGQSLFSLTNTSNPLAFGNIPGGFAVICKDGIRIFEDRFYRLIYAVEEEGIIGGAIDEDHGIIFYITRSRGLCARTAAAREIILEHAAEKDIDEVGVNSRRSSLYIHTKNELQSWLVK